MANNKSNNTILIMTYHSLQTRDPRYIHCFWEVSVFIGLILIVGLGMMSNLSIQRILDTYDDSNVFTATLRFMCKNSSDDNEIENPWNAWATAPTTQIFPNASESERDQFKINSTSTTQIPHNDVESELNSSHLRRDLMYFTDFPKFIGYENKTKAKGNIYRKRSIKHIFAFVDPSTLNTTFRDSFDSDEYEFEIIADQKFIQEMKIDTNKTTFGTIYLRDYMVFYPLFSAIVAVQWLILLYNFRSRGYFNFNWERSRPWQMVPLSIIVHLVMTIGSAIYNYYSEYYFEQFCTNLGKNLTHPEEFRCGYLMDNLYVQSWQEMEFVTTTSSHYNIYRSAIQIILILWFLICLVVIIRFIAAVDFRLIRVRISAFIPLEKLKRDELETVTTQLDGINDLDFYITKLSENELIENSEMFYRRRKVRIANENHEDYQ